MANQDRGIAKEAQVHFFVAESLIKFQQNMHAENVF